MPVATKRGRTRDRKPAGPVTSETIFKLLKNKTVRDIIEAVHYKSYTLPGLAARIGKSKGTVCSCLKELEALGIVQKYLFKEKARYRIVFKPIIVHTRRTNRLAEKLEAWRRRRVSCGANLEPARPGPADRFAASRQAAAESGRALEAGAGEEPLNRPGGGTEDGER